MSQTAVSATISVIAALAAILATLVAVRLNWFKGSQTIAETEHQEDRVLAETLKETIAAVREQNAILREENAHYKAREERWEEERKELNRRLTEIESDYRKLVTAITAGRICLNAPECDNYTPGDRRQS